MQQRQFGAITHKIILKNPLQMDLQWVGFVCFTAVELLYNAI
jgi:hypothetical protein